MRTDTGTKVSGSRQVQSSGQIVIVNSAPLPEPPDVMQGEALNPEPTSAAPQPRSQGATQVASPQTAAETKDQKKSFEVPDALLILLITAVAYLLVFSYEAGFCRYFGIEQSLIRPDLTTFLTYGAMAVGVSILLYQAVIVFCSISPLLFPPNRKRPILKSLVTYAAWFGIAFILAWSENFRGIDAFFVMGVVVFWFAFNFLTPFAFMRSDEHRRSYAHHFEDLQQVQKDTSLPFDKAVKKQGLSTLVGMFILFVVANGISFRLGKLEARLSDTFLCRDVPRKEVVLKVYGGTGITARRDNSVNVYPEFCIVKLEGDTNAFTLKKIGRLRPQLPQQAVTVYLSPVSVSRFDFSTNSAKASVTAP